MFPTEHPLMRALLGLQEAMALLAVVSPFELTRRLTKVGGWALPLNRGIAVGTEQQPDPAFRRPTDTSKSRFVDAQGDDRIGWSLVPHELTGKDTPRSARTNLIAASTKPSRVQR
jgi:hypothetical protein